MYSYYGKLSTAVYDIDKPIGVSFGDVEYYTKKLQDTTGTVLEPGVGTGRIMLPLLEAGIDVEGFDVSDDMLSLCKHNAEERGCSPLLYVARMEEFDQPRQYEAIIIPTGSFLLLPTKQDAIEALTRFYTHLQKQGRLYIDLIFPAKWNEGATSVRSWEVDDQSIFTLTASQVDYSLVSQQTTSVHRYEKWENGMLKQSELEKFTLNWYGIEEFRYMLEQAGFCQINFMADYTEGKQLDSHTEVVTVEAFKL